MYKLFTFHYPECDLANVQVVVGGSDEESMLKKAFQTVALEKADDRADEIIEE